MKASGIFRMLLKKRHEDEEVPVLPAEVPLLVLDFDGVLTDNRIIVLEDGSEGVICDRGDGWGIARLKDVGVQVLVLSTESNPVVAARCRKLNIECIQGCDKKVAALREFAERRGITSEDIAYVGNDVNDLECLRWVGMPIAVADARPEVIGAARWVTRNRGGHGAAREVADWILAALHRDTTLAEDNRAVEKIR